MTETSIGIGGPEDKGLSLGVQRVAAPLREQVLDLLRQAIVEHRLKPGQRLIERELVEQIGVSRTTIREVLRQLAAEGLVATIPQRGAVVAVPTAEEAAELYEVRAALESLAARRFVEHASESQVTALRAAYEEVARVMSAGDAADTLAMIQSKDLFYDVLLKGSGNRAIHSILSGLTARVSVLRATSMARPGRAQQSLAELEAIVVAIENGDADAAADACAHHVEMAARAGQAAVARRRSDVSDLSDVVAVRYATLNSTLGALYYRWADYGEPDGPQVMDYFFYVLRGDGRTIVVDCGFDPVAGARRGRTCLTEPVEALRAARHRARGGGDDAHLPPALRPHRQPRRVRRRREFLVPERELAFWTSDVARYHGFWHHVEADEIARVADLHAAGRVDTYGGATEIAPGLHALEVGGHSPGQQILLVDTASGRLVLDVRRRPSVRGARAGPSLRGAGRPRGDVPRLRDHQAARRRAGDDGRPRARPRGHAAVPRRRGRARGRRPPARLSRPETRRNPCRPTTAGSS